MNDQNQIHLLLVDDEADFLQATAQALSRRGFVVTAAESGERALALLSTDSFDIVVLDLKMNGLSGLQTLERLRGSHPDLPVLILTGHGGVNEAYEGIQLGIVDFVQKPVDIVALASQLRRLVYLGQRGPLREKTVRELLRPLGAYRRIYADEGVREVLRALDQSLFQDVAGKINEQETRTVLVYSRAEEFVGCVRISDVLDLVIPAALRGSPYASYLTGMFIAQCKVLGQQTAAELVGDETTIAIDAPLLEAAHLMVSRRLINLPVLDGGRLVGLLRDKDLFREIVAAALPAT